MNGAKSTDLGAIMRFRNDIRRMIADPELTDDTLLFAICLYEICTRNEESARRRFRRNWMKEITDLAQGADQDVWWARRVIRKDVPRYEPAGLHTRVGCVAPMIRREGPCGRNTYTSYVDRDPITGVGQYVGYCTRHWSDEKEMERRRRTKEWQDNGQPSPGPNRSGVLRRYFRANWDELYKWAAPYTTPLEGAREAKPPRPVFQVIQGGA